MPDNEINRLENVEPLEVSLVPKGAVQRDFLILKNKEGKAEMSEEQKQDEVNKQEEDYNEKQEDVDVREVAANLAKIWDITTGEALELIDTLEPQTALEQSNPDHYEDEEEVNMEDIAKSDLPDEVKEQVEVIFKEQEKMRKENKEIRKQLQQEIEEKRKQEFVAKAEQFENISVDPDEFGVVLKNISETSEDAYNKVMEVLKSADEVVKQGDLFVEKGSSLENTKSDSWGKIEKTAENLKNNDPSMSKEQAINKALKDNPDLYNAYMQDQQ